MKKTFLFFLFAAVIALSFATAWAAGPLEFMKNIGKTVEADPNKSYMLTDAEGPYLIYVMTFATRQEAHAFVLELRKTYKWNAYWYEKTFVHDASKDFKPPPNPFFKTKISYLKSRAPQTQYAVLVGNFVSMEDKQYEKTLEDIRKCKPASLKNLPSPTPCVMAFGCSNPMLPPEHQRGFVDPYIASINSKRPYSLLQNPRRYTVQIASFRGESAGFAWNNTIEHKPPTGMSALEQGEQNAVALCKALRDRGVEAYEFHDRYASIVTVGSFDDDGQPMPDGTKRLHPQVQQIIDQYQMKTDPRTGSRIPHIINGIACDPQPKIIEVPRARRTP